MLGYNRLLGEFESVPDLIAELSVPDDSVHI